MTREELIEELLQLPECAEVRITHDALLQSFPIDGVRVKADSETILLESRAEIKSGDVETMLHYYNAQERRRARRAIDGIWERAEADRQKRG